MAPAGPEPVPGQFLFGQESLSSENGEHTRRKKMAKPKEVLA